MAKPRIFVSSTYYDLKHIRRHIETFIKQMGYESVLFESGDIPFHHDQPLDESCYAEIDTCHILILIIGGRYGSPASSEETSLEKESAEKAYEYYNSITKKEYIKARERGIPIFIFVEKGVYAEFDTYKKNRKNESITFAHVDNKNVFKLLDEIVSQRTNNFVKGFESFDDITNWLKEQWAGIFADFLGKKNTDIKLKNLQDQIEELKEISTAIKVYNESLIRSSKVKGASEMIKQEEYKLKVRRASRLRKEPLIDYLLTDRDTGLSMVALYDLFRSTISLEQFSLAIGVEAERVNDLNKRAHEEYKLLRNNYLDENNPVDLNEVDNEEKTQLEIN